jgi:hypothetical protein
VDLCRGSGKVWRQKLRLFGVRGAEEGAANAGTPPSLSARSFIMTRTPTFISGCGRSKYATPIRVYEKLATGTTGFSLLRDRICSVRDADLSSMWLVLNSSMNELATMRSVTTLTTNTMLFPGTSISCASSDSALTGSGGTFWFVAANAQRRSVSHLPRSSTGGYPYPESCILTLTLDSTPLILHKSRMRRRACNGSVRGRSAMSVPTGTIEEAKRIHWPQMLARSVAGLDLNQRRIGNLR